MRNTSATQLRAKFKMASVAKTTLSSSARKRSKRSEDMTEELQVSGFKFSRQSRYRKVAQKKGSGTKSARKKRRSSFALERNKRKSLVYSSVPSRKSELYKEIPTDMPPKERLKKIFDVHLKDAMEKLDSNLPEFSVEGIPSCNEEAKEVFLHLQALISDSNIVDEEFQPANSKVKQIPKPKIQDMEAKFMSCLAVTERWKTENKKWDELLSFHQELVAKKESEHQEEDAKPTNECPDFLSPEQHQLLSGKPSLKSLMERVDKMRQNTFLQVDDVFGAINTLTEYQETTESFINTQLKTLAKKTFEATKQTGTPRTVIPRLLKKL